MLTSVTGWGVSCIRFSAHGAKGEPPTAGRDDGNPRVIDAHPTLPKKVVIRKIAGILFKERSNVGAMIMVATSTRVGAFGSYERSSDDDPSAYHVLRGALSGRNDRISGLGLGERPGGDPMIELPPGVLPSLFAMLIVWAQFNRARNNRVD